MIPAQIVAQAPPDGYTLLSYASTIWLLPYLQNVLYDPVKDFSPITLAVSSPNILVVHPSLSVRSVKELIVLARARPGALSYASTAAGGPPHLAAELFKSMAGVDIMRVPYKGAGLALTELLAGQVQLYFLIPTAVLFRIAGPRVRPWICVASGVTFFVYFSVTELAGWVGAACVLIFVWESLISRLYRPNSVWCLVGVAASLGVLAVFKYWNFFTGLATASLDANPFYWPGAFLPLGVSFFPFEFIHYAVDRYKGRVERGTLGEYLAFIFFFPTLVAGPIKRFQAFETAAQLGNSNRGAGGGHPHGLPVV